MRLPGTVLGALLILVAGPVSAEPDESPWCTELDPFTRYCVYASYQDCQAAAKVAGATCVRNPRYQAPPTTAHAKPRRQAH